MIGPSNSFKNIWLADRYQAMSREQQQGILFYVKHYRGTLNLGHADGPMTISNIEGLFNPFTIERFPKWNPQEFPFLDGLSSDQTDLGRINVLEGYMINGAGAPLFNIHSEKNLFDAINIENVDI